MSEEKLPVFKLSNITYAYPGGNEILKDISFEVMQGEKVSILGANGCGKSTLLKILSGLMLPVSGRIEVFGEALSEIKLSNDKFSKNYHRRIGFIFQHSDVQLFCSNVLEEIAFGPLQLGLPENEVKQRVNDIINMLNIESIKNMTPFKLSGGEKKKVAIASVLVLNPEVLILDEPTNELDPRTQRWIVELLMNLNRAGKTLVFSTHHLELAQEISGRAILFSEDHRIAADGLTSSLLENIQLLKDVNLVDDYYHRHEGQHSHFHIHNY